MKKYMDIQTKAESISEIINDMKVNNNLADLDRIKEILNDIIDET